MQVIDLTVACSPLISISISMADILQVLTSSSLNTSSAPPGFTNFIYQARPGSSIIQFNGSTLSFAQMPSVTVRGSGDHPLPCILWLECICSVTSRAITLLLLLPHIV